MVGSNFSGQDVVWQTAQTDRHSYKISPIKRKKFICKSQTGHQIDYFFATKKKINRWKLNRDFPFSSSELLW